MSAEEVLLIQDVRSILKVLLPDEDWDDEHHRETAKRWMKAMRDLTSSEEHTFEFTTFASKTTEMIVVQDITFASLCAHHILPFIGKAHIAYIPDGRIVGLSKLARTVKFFAKGLWVQEELATQIANYLDENLEPLGVGVVMSARHSCMEIRGIEADGALTTTSAMRGVFLEESRGARNEFLSILRNRANLI